MRVLLPTKPPRKDPFSTSSIEPLPLWRFVLMAAAVVAVIGSVVFARRGGAPDLKISAKLSGTPTPTAQRSEPDAPEERGAFLGSGSWTLSSLPECFRERQRLGGTVAQLRPMFPPSAQRLGVASVVRSGDCTIRVGVDTLQIARGADRLRVPPQAALYRSAGRLILVYIHGTHAEIRRY